MKEALRGRVDKFVAVPIAAALAVPLTWSLGGNPFVLAIVVALLVGAVLTAVHHAETIARHVGEPYGALILALAVTVIEVALIVTLMLDGGAQVSSLARDTVFAAVMLTINGILGISVLLAALRDRIAVFNAEGAATALATALTLATLSLVLPNFTTSAAGPTFVPAQLAFAAIVSLVLYAVFLVVQTVRHPDQYMADDADTDMAEPHGDPPTTRAAVLSGAMLLVALIGVVGLTKVASTAVKGVVTDAGAPASAVGVLIAVLVLLPETLTAVRAARRGHVQTSINLALGSAIASIGLTVPVIATLSIVFNVPLVLGLGGTQIVLLAITAVVGALTVLPGRATVQEGALHLVLAGTFLFLALVP